MPLRPLLVALPTIAASVGIALLASQPPAPRPREEAKTQQPESSHNRSNTAVPSNSPEGAPSSQSPDSEIQREHSNGHGEQPASRNNESRALPTIVVLNDDVSWWLIIPTWVVALVAAFQFIAFMKQLATMRDTLTATNDTAEATAASVDAFVAAERPWLAVRFDGNPHRIGGGGLSGRTRSPTPNTELDFSFRAKLQNYGRTPAWIVSLGIECFVVPMPIPIDQPFPEQEEAGNRLLGPIAATGPSRPITRVCKLSPQDREDILSGEAAVIMLGLVRYRGPLPDIHRSGFCFAYRRISAGVWIDSETRESRWAQGWDEALWFVTNGPQSYFVMDTEKEPDQKADGRTTA